MPESPNYSDHLAWTELRSLLSRRLSGNLRYEQHLTPGKRGAWVRPGIEYFAGSRFRLFAQANLLAGQDYSYFGTWRSLDSVAMGARLAW
jgi:hypothetical protein